MSLTAAQQAELIANAATGIKSVSTDGTRTEGHSLSDVVAFLKYCNQQQAATDNSSTNPVGMRRMLRVGPGTTGTT